MESGKRLIDANALLLEIEEELSHESPFFTTEQNKLIDIGLRIAAGDIRHRPTVDAVEVVHGEWSIIEDDYLGLIALQCSECNEEYWFEEELPLKGYNYCPNCGAKMRGSEE